VRLALHEQLEERLVIDGLRSRRGVEEEEDGLGFASDCGIGKVDILICCEEE
jgi:hypothetical protein